MLENSTVLSGGNPSFPGRAIVVTTNSTTIHQAPIGFVDRCVLSFAYPTTATSNTVLSINVAGFEAINIEMPPGSVYTYDAALESTEAQPTLTITAMRTGGDQDIKCSGYVMRGGEGKALRR